MALELTPVFQSMRSVKEGACLIEVMDTQTDVVIGYVLAVLPEHAEKAESLCNAILASGESRARMFDTHRENLEAYRRERRRLMAYLLMDEPRQSAYWRGRALDQLIHMRIRAGLTPDRTYRDFGTDREESKND